MVKQFFISLAFLLFSIGTFAQKDIYKLHQAQWQQSCNYKLEVELNDKDHILIGSGEYEYTNNSPNSLDVLYFHLWPNAYASNSTAFAQQQRENQKTDFEFAKIEDRGWIQELNFTSNGKDCKWELDSINIDICKVYLNSTLQSGEKVLIKTPFKVKIPGRFSRFGHREDNYQITQWFPKPAVYDVNGWHAMPYLDQGEFYSEFGNFDVSITVPANYIVAATGELQNESEKEFILNRINNPIDSEREIESSPQTKTLRYKQGNIHDFAWFASKNFNVETSTVEIDGREIELYGFAAKQDFNYTKHISKGIEYYSEHVGPYPYKYCSAVYGALEAGGGMEYPMITVLSSTQREVIIHEVGHNWFYGILANDERRYPWMDESFNSYFDHEATRLKILNSDANLNRPRIANHLFDINDYIMILMAEYAERQELHQAIGLHSMDFTETNYGTMVYGKGASIFQHLRTYLGDTLMDDCFHEYFNKWKYKHPLPGDVQKVFEEVSGKNLDWFFEGIVNGKGHLDWKMEKLESNKLTVSNNGDVQSPFSIGLFSEGELVHELWIEPGERTTVEIEIPSGIEYDLAKIDPYVWMFESNRDNNSIRPKGLFPKFEKLDFDYFTGVENPNTSQIFWTPIVGWNTHDKWMPGLYLSNFSLPGKKWNYRLMPMFSTEDDVLSGFAKINYNHYRQAKLWKTDMGVKAASFGFFRNYKYSYNKIKPYVEFNFRPEDLRSHSYSKVEINSNVISFTPRFDQDEQLDLISNDTTGRRRFHNIKNDLFVDVKFETGNKRIIDPHQTKLQFRWGSVSRDIVKRDLNLNTNNTRDFNDQFAQVEFEHTRTISYNIPEKGLEVRLYGGIFLDEPLDAFYGFRLGTQGGRYDYTFDHVVMGRGANEGVYSQQSVLYGPSLKLNGNLGAISSWVASCNITVDLPLKGPVQLYADLFTFRNIQRYPNNTAGDKFGYSGGIKLELIPSMFDIYIPLLNSEFIQLSQKNLGYDKFVEKISFQLNLNLLEPQKLLELIGI